MLRSFLPTFTVAIALTFGVVSCSTQTPHSSLPLATVRTATMDITPGIEVLTRVALPDGFVPSADYPPMWLQAGQEVGIVGTQNGHALVMGYGGIGYRTARVIAQDGGVGAPDASIVDLAPSPNGMVLALAVANSKERRLDVVTRDLISEGAASPVSNFDGDFDSVSIGWLSEFNASLALRAHLESEAARESATVPDSAPTPESNPAPSPAASSGLYVINLSGVVTTGYMKLDCQMSQLSWSPDGLVAVGSGDAEALPTIIDRGKESCRRINAPTTLRVLDWAHDSKSFLYEETERTPGTAAYRFDLASGAARLVAISSGAAAFVSDDQVLALGNGALTFRDAQRAPDGPVRAELALSNPSGTNTEVESLGFNSTPAMLAASKMTYTHETDEAAIATFGPTTEGPMRKLVIYSVAPRRAFLVAFGSVRGILAMSWSPQGRYLAIVDGDGTASALTIVAPPR
jgi:hypothetical protein